MPTDPAVWISHMLYTSNSTAAGEFASFPGTMRGKEVIRSLRGHIESRCDPAPDDKMRAGAVRRAPVRRRGGQLAR